MTYFLRGFAFRVMMLDFQRANGEVAVDIAFATCRRRRRWRDAFLDCLRDDGRGEEKWSEGA